VPDFYQGTETWFSTLVDPDNRRPVDFDFRIGALKTLRQLHSSGSMEDFLRHLTGTPDDGLIKLYVTTVLLNFRNKNRQLFGTGRYIPLVAEGENGQCICSFARSLDNQVIVVVVPRFSSRLLRQSKGLSISEDMLADSVVLLPEVIPSGTYRNLFTNQVLMNTAEDRKLPLNGVFSGFPVAVLERFETT
jgi:(1->4)-alpha-D-glucan 1-alpha-D-glucosylmutase